MAKNDQDQGEDLATKKSRLEAEAKAKADAYAKEKADEAARVAEDAEAEAKAKREQAEKASAGPELVNMKKGPEVLEVHVSAVEDHKKVGWEVC